MSFDHFRFDHYQMGGFVVVTVYAKLCNPKKSLVETNLTGVSNNNINKEEKVLNTKCGMTIFLL